MANTLQGNGYLTHPFAPFSSHRVTFRAKPSQPNYVLGVALCGVARCGARVTTSEGLVCSACVLTLMAAAAATTTAMVILMGNGNSIGGGGGDGI